MKKKIIGTVSVAVFVLLVILLHYVPIKSEPADYISHCLDRPDKLTYRIISGEYNEYNSATNPVEYGSEPTPADSYRNIDLGMCAPKSLDSSVKIKLFVF